MLLLKIILLIAPVAWLIALAVAYADGLIGRRIRRNDCARAPIAIDTPPFSVIIAAHNQATQLRRYLPEILEQDYERFEVIVVDMISTDDTKDILERLEMQYANLRHTFVPASARDISIERLALTLGFRAAAYEWVVITHPDCHPASSQWLRRIGETIIQPRIDVQSSRLKEPDMVLGFARYDEQRSTWFDHKVGFYRLWNTMGGIQHVLTGHAAVRADGCNMAYRKSLFLANGGFAAAQDLKAGAEELLVNQNSTPVNTALLLSPAALVMQERLTSLGQWKKRLVFYAETRRHQRHTFIFRAKQLLRMVTPWLMILAVMFPMMIGIVMILMDPQPESIAMTTALAMMLLSYIAVRLSCFHTTTRALSCRSYFLSLLLMDLLLPLWNLSAWSRRRFTAQNEFRKKFV